MSSETIKVLLIDDDEDDYVLTRELLSLVRTGKYELDWVSSYEEGLTVAGRLEHHVCLVDYHLGERSGVQLIREARESRLTTPMILLTGQGDHDVDVEAMHAGATDYLVKDETSPARLERTIRYAVRLNSERRRAEGEVGAHVQKQHAVAEIGRLALTGGELKDLFAEAVSLVARTLGVEYCKVLEVLPDGEALILRAGVGWKEEYRVGQATVSAGKDSQAGFTLLSDGPVIVEDLRTETRFSGPPLLLEHGIVSGMSVIIRGRERPYGVLGAHTASKRDFAEDDVNFLRSVANVLAEAIGRKQDEEALRESEARNRAILESSMDCIIGMDHRGLVVDWNPAAEETFGYSRREAIGRNMAELIIPERFRERHHHGLTRYLATGKGRLIGQRLELSAQRSDGTEFPIELTITRIESKGEPIFTGYLRDITKRKKAELRLSAQYAVTRALAESNTITEGASKILQAVCESLGWEYGSLWIVDRNSNVLRCSQVWQAQEAEAVEFERVSRQSVFGPGVGLPGRVWRDGQPAWILDVVEDKNFPRSPFAARAGLHSGCAFPITFRSEMLGVMEFFSHSIRESDSDLLAMMVTIGSQIGQFIERKRVEAALSESEDQLRQSQKLEAVGQLAGGVAHDFNNLLTVIGGYSSMLLGKLAPDSPHRPSIEEIKRAGERAEALTRQLLAFSRKQILQPRVLDLNVVVTDLEKMVRRLIGEDIDLLTITSPVLGKVKADPGQIEQVLLNLIVNARDAMPKGGKLTIETCNVEHSEEYALRHAALPGPFVMLIVSDNGCGMDAATQPRVFEPFFTTKGTGKGTGLGLATVYGIVKQSGGGIGVYSEVGRGSTFKVWLPRVDQIVETGDEAIPKSIPKGTETVLLVEDENQVRAIVQEILELQGYHVVAAANGEEALTISQDLKLDIKIMITDVVMPQMSGRELAERVIALRPGLPVLFISGYTDDAIVRHGLLDEKLNFLQKPFDSATVARKVREVLDSHLYLTPA